MPTISDLFKSQKKELYGTSDTIRIESRGLINPPRAAALLLSSPNSLGDLIGNQIAGAVGGSANRPSDTIFKHKTLLSKPISLFKSPADLRTAVDAKTDYYVKQSPSPDSIIETLNQGASNLGGTVINLARTTGIPTTKRGLNNLANSLKKPKPQVYSNKNKFSKSVDINEQWDTDLVQNIDKIESDKLNEVIKAYTGRNQVIVLFKKYGKSTTIPFEGTITGLSEDATPEWANFKYLGSPFKSYRYLGVERILKFNLKLYYITHNQKENMVKKINYLKSLVFPYDEISTIQYNGNQQNPIDEPIYSQYAFSPNLVYLSIGDMYKNVFGFIETLSFSIQDNVTWPTLGVDGIDNYMYPSVIDVVLSMKIIENHKVENKDGTITKYKYDFDGRGDKFIKETALEIQQDTAIVGGTGLKLPPLKKFTSNELLGINQFNKKS